MRNTFAKTLPARTAGADITKGSIDCSGNPNYPVGVSGDRYKVSAAGKIGGASGIVVDVGDVIECLVDNAGGTQAAVGSSWFIVQANLVGALVSANNLSDVASATTSRTNLGVPAGSGTSTGTNTGDQVLPTRASLSVDNTDNTSDANKPVSTATQTALNFKIAITSVPYDIACQITGKPDASAVVLRFIAVRAFTLLASGQRGTAGTGATAQTDFKVAVNGATKATLRFAVEGVTITVVDGTAATIAVGDVITITAPNQDATLADIGFTLTGTLL